MNDEMSCFVYQNANAWMFKCHSLCMIMPMHECSNVMLGSGVYFMDMTMHERLNFILSLYECIFQEYDMNVQVFFVFSDCCWLEHEQWT